MSPNTTTNISCYPLTGPGSETVLKNALKILKPNLPVSIPLYRRLQFGRFFDATCLLSNISLDASTTIAAEGKEPWLIAFVDRSCRPETEVWVSASWENDNSTAISKESAAYELVRNLILAMKDLSIPTSIHEDIVNGTAETSTNHQRVDVDHAGLSLKDYGGHAVDPNIMLWGATHEKTVEIMKDLCVLSYKFKTVLMPDYTFIWDVSTLPEPRALPEGLRWRELKPEHFELVKSRTQIPRQDRTLAILPNLGIFPEGTDEPVSWAFVGLDASLTTLHVEPEYRGRGLAKAITTKLFKEKMDLFWEDGVSKLAHGYVIAGNEESAGMCKSLGGASRWDVYWLRVDLGLA